MSWQCPRQLKAPWPGLPQRTVAVDGSLRLKVAIATGGDPDPDPITCWLREQCADPTLRLQFEESDWQPAELPAPWHRLTLTADPAALARAQQAELLFSLRLLAAKTLGKPPYRAYEAVNRFMKLSDQPRRLREAVFFAFIDKPALFDGMGYWLEAVRSVVVERRPLAQRRNPESPLLQLGFRLLEKLQALRENCRTREDMERLWERFEAESADGLDLPATCAAVYWGEAVYRLSELNELEAAAALLARQQQALNTIAERLPGVDADDFKAGMWHHHLGRLAYYRGDMAAALEQYHQQHQHRHRLDCTSRARLHRSLANVLADIGCLAAAQRQAEEAIRLQQSSDEAELFKSHGRLAEIFARQGRYPEALAAYQRSWALQEQRQHQRQPDDQTAVYLGHIHLLSGDVAAAEAQYDEAEHLYGDHRFNPYLHMGRAALFCRTRQWPKLAQLWADNGDRLGKLGGEKVLPLAVVVMARHLAGQAPVADAQQMLARLKEENYWLEACFLLPYLFPGYQPADQADQAIEGIMAKLKTWQQQARPFCGPLADGDGYFSLPGLLADLEQAMARRSWDGGAHWRRIYPFKLLLAD